MRILIIAILMLVNAEVNAQKHIMNGEIAFSAVALSANYEGFITNHFSMGSNQGLIALGAKANYYLKPIDYNQWNGHVGLGYELSLPGSYQMLFTDQHSLSVLTYFTRGFLNRVGRRSNGSFIGYYYR